MFQVNVSEGRSYLSTGAGFLPATVLPPTNYDTAKPCKQLQIWIIH